MARLILNAPARTGHAPATSQLRPLAERQCAGSSLLSQALPDFLPGNRPIGISICCGQSAFQFLAVPFRDWQLLERIRDAIPQHSYQVQPLRYTEPLDSDL